MWPSDQAVSPLEPSSKIKSFLLSLSTSFICLATETRKVTNYMIQRTHSNVNEGLQWIISGLAFGYNRYIILMQERHNRILGNRDEIEGALAAKLFVNLKLLNS